MANYSLSQRRMMAQMAGEKEIVLSLEEADEVLAQIAGMDRKLAEYWDHLPEEVQKAECEEMYGPRPDDSLKRCVYCNNLPDIHDSGIECCDAYDGSFYWEDVFEDEDDNDSA